MGSEYAMLPLRNGTWKTVHEERVFSPDFFFLLILSMEALDASNVLVVSISLNCLV